MKKKIVLFVSCFALLIVFVLLLQENISLRKDINEYNSKDNKSIKKENTLSMMIETSAGSGKYEMETRTSWPTISEGYIFNAMLSKCENGNILSWNDEKNTVTVSGSMSDKCYVYFDAVQKAVINEIITSDITTTSMTITIDATEGTFDISKYYYSIDDGTTWNESTSNVITISGLTMGIEYTIKSYVQDNKGINSEYKSTSVTTLNVNLITFGYTVFSSKTTYYAEEGMTWAEWVNSSYNTDSFVVNNYGVYSDMSYIIYSDGSGDVSANDTIIDGYSYNFRPCTNLDCV